ncbi:chromatin remodeling protein EBS-like [Helianthus annuus]|uniref:chromatin remodeling protein EBS-like n=1 Tax=Helianthus annuus TaxID=4232 RepID=UPI001652BA71|nr:chromatin remodeling protein EBS-like [Helianthus annuus]
MALIRWYYLPEETEQGRKSFHGIKEVFLSNHYEVQSIHTIQGKYVVYSLENYMNLKRVGVDDYFCRFEYNYVKKCHVDVFVVVYCECEMPYNPDLFIVQCDGCKCRNGVFQIRSHLSLLLRLGDFIYSLSQKRQFFHSHRAQTMASEQLFADQRDSEDEVDDDVAGLED